MTLNITVLSPGGIHQSADFQISNTEKNAEGNWIALQENASKIISLHFRSWSGLVTYCGIGLWRGVRTDQYLSDWLSQCGREATFHDVLETIRRKGSLWIAEINRYFGEIKPHSFVQAGFEGGTLRYAMVSNYQSLNGDIRPFANDLQRDVRSTTGVHVLVTGIRDAVTDENKRLLKHMIESGKNFAMVQHYLAKTNRKAAQSTKARMGISASCLTYTCIPNGQQWSKVHGVVPGQVNPLAIDGEAAGALMRAELWRQFPNAKLVQSAYSTSEAQQQEIGRRIDCDLRFQSGFVDRDRARIAEVEELRSLNEYALDVKAINVSQAMVGHIRDLPDATPRAFFRKSNGVILRLGSFGGAQAYAVDLNEKNQVVGRAGIEGSGMHAFIWSERDGLHDLGTLGGRNSQATSINDHGVVVGTSGRHPVEPNAPDECAFVWTPERKLVALDLQFDGWSRAYQINNAGWVIGWRGHHSVDCGYVWSPDFGVIELTIGRDRPFYVCAINDSGLVVGEGDDDTGKRRPYCWTRETGIKQLNTDCPFHPCRVDSDGIIIGTVSGGNWPLSRPFIYTPSGELLPLPYAEDHHTALAAINRDRIIVGDASLPGSWKHKHPIMWRLTIA
jgi:probable HAF family extracellular repeat protein